MTQKNPSKNIKSVMVDITSPSRLYRQTKTLINLSKISSAPPSLRHQTKKYWRTIIPLFFISFLILLVIFFSSFQKIKSQFLSIGQLVSANLSLSFNDLKMMRWDEAIASLKKNLEAFKNLDELFKKYQISKISNFSFTPTAFKQFANFFFSLSKINLDFLSFLDHLQDLKLNGLSYFENNGPLLISKLKELKSISDSLIEQGEKAKNAANYLKDISSSFTPLHQEMSLKYFNELSYFRRFNQFLAGLLKTFDSDKEKHLLVVFQNPYLLRPTGGQIQAVADIKFLKGQIAEINVLDVLSGPEKFEQKIIPPLPLQSINKKWGLSEANWFFDFPLSAKKIIFFVENSPFYAEKDIHFEGVIALNINIFKDLLTIIGPIKLSLLTIDEKNFQTTMAEQENFLQEFFPLFLKKIAELNQEKKSMLFEKLLSEINKKEIAFYSVEPLMQQFFVLNQIAGAVSDLPNDFFGTYLALVESQINEKTKTLTKEKISLKINLQNDGSSLNDLTFQKTNENEKETQKNFINIFTNPSSQFLFLKGSSPQKKVHYFDYGSDYQKDSDIEAIEEKMSFDSDNNFWTTFQSNKKVLSAWFNLEPHETKILNFSYQIPFLQNDKNFDGLVYHFMVEKQSGIEREWEVVFRAPAGYVWKNNQSAVFTFSGNDSFNPIVLDLTLTKRL